MNFYFPFRHFKVGRLHDIPKGSSIMQYIDPLLKRKGTFIFASLTHQDGPVSLDDISDILDKHKDDFRTISEQIWRFIRDRKKEEKGYCDTSMVVLMEEMEDLVTHVRSETGAISVNWTMCKEKYVLNMDSKDVHLLFPVIQCVLDAGYGCSIPHQQGVRFAPHTKFSVEHMDNLIFYELEAIVELFEKDISYARRVQIHNPQKRFGSIDTWKNQEHRNKAKIWGKQYFSG